MSQSKSPPKACATSANTKFLRALHALCALHALLALHALCAQHVIACIACMHFIAKKLALNVFTSKKSKLVGEEEEEEEDPATVLFC